MTIHRFSTHPSMSVNRVCSSYYELIMIIFTWFAASKM